MVDLGGVFQVASGCIKRIMSPEQAFRRLPRAGDTPCTPLNINLFRMGWAVGGVLGMMATSRRRSIGSSLKMDFVF